MASQTGSDSYHTKVYDILDENNTKKYYIKYKGHFTNHVSYGLYALDKLCVPESRVIEYVQFYVRENLEAAEVHRERETREDPRPENPDDLIGTRRSYYYLYDCYEKLLEGKYGGSLDMLIAGEFPKLASGMVGSALHGMIHLGYGYASGRPWFVCEGLAYLNFSNVPLRLSNEVPALDTLGMGSENILDVVSLIGQDKDLISFMNEAITRKEWAEMITSEFQKQTGVLFSYRGDDLLKYTNMIQFPSSLSAKEMTLDKVNDLGKWMVDCAIIVYAISDKPNDFFLLHGVTCAWSLRNVLVLLDDCQQVLEAARTFICVLFAAYLAQGSPPLQTSLVSSNSGMEHNWADIVRKAVEHEQIGEEHMYKCVQVCKEMSSENTDTNMEAMYRLAAHNCVTYPMSF